LLDIASAGQVSQELSSTHASPTSQEVWLLFVLSMHIHELSKDIMRLNSKTGEPTYIEIQIEKLP
jgi:hypothetical protein